jgi:PAS domain S-box-containing protein
MPTTRAARRAVPTDAWSRGRAVVTGALVGAWFVVLVYAAAAADDANEVALDLVVLVLGLLAVGSASLGTLRQAAHRLRHAERRIAAMTGGSLLAWECDHLGRITYAGALAEEHFGYPLEELLGSDIRGLVHPQELDRLTAMLADGTGWTEERWRCVTKDGTERWFAGSAVADVGPDGRVRGFVGSSYPLGKDALDEHRLSEIAARVYERLDGGAITPVFQPILSVSTGRLIGAEGLTRFPGSDLNPDEWFGDAAEVGLGVELELAALRRLLALARDLPDDLYVSLNVGPQTLVRAELMETLLTSGIPAERVVLEVTEHASISEYDDVLVAVSALRSVGVRLAVDDAGAGYASFRHILRLNPEIIKLDRSLIAGLHGDPARRALAAAVVAFGLELGSTVTAEGIETPEELRAAQDLGIHGAQGYLFGRPVADWSTWCEWHARGAVYSVSAAGMASV